MRIRFALLLMVAGLLVAAGVATAQTTTTDTTGSYTSTTPTGSYTSTVPATTTQEAAPATEGASQGAAPAVAGQTQAAPSNLAFTGAEPLLLIIVGLVMAGGTATLLVRDRRRSAPNR